MKTRNVKFGFVDMTILEDKNTILMKGKPVEIAPTIFILGKSRSRPEEFTGSSYKANPLSRFVGEFCDDNGFKSSNKNCVGGTCRIDPYADYESDLIDIEMPEADYEALENFWDEEANEPTRPKGPTKD